MPLRIVLCLEESIAQCHRLYPLHVYVACKLGVNVEEHGHIHRLARVQPLLLKAKALDLGKVRRHLPWRYAVRRHPDDVLLRRVRRGVEGQRSLAG